jgi:hypothetical protein
MQFSFVTVVTKYLSKDLLALSALYYGFVLRSVYETWNIQACLDFSAFISRQTSLAAIVFPLQ